MTKIPAALFAGLLLSLAACGGSDDDEVAATAISDSIMKEQAGAAGVFTMKRPEADCIGEGFVEGIGVERLQEYGFLDEDLKAEPMSQVEMENRDAEAATDVLFDCTDVTSLMSEALAEGGQVDAKTRACLDDVLTDENLRAMFTLMFSGKQDEASQKVIAPMMQCASGSAEQQ